MTTVKHVKKRRFSRQSGPDCPIPADSTYNCDPSTKYRTIDGTCNNLQNPKWGGSNRGVARFIGPDYSDGEYILCLCGRLFLNTLFIMMVVTLIET